MQSRESALLKEPQPLSSSGPIFFSSLFAELRGTRPQAGKKMGPELIACACASFYTKNLLKDLE